MYLDLAEPWGGGKMLVWILTYIIVLDNVPTIQEYSYHQSMMECFQARENLKTAITSSEHFPIGSQAVCISTLEKDPK